MIKEGTPLKKENKGYKIALILLIGLAAISGARKDLNQLLSLANDVQAFANHWLGGILPAVHARSVSSTEVCHSSESAMLATSDQFRWTGRVEQGRTIEIKGLSGNINAEPAGGIECSEFPLTLTSSMSRKQVSGTIGSGGRELVLKTLNGSINLKWSN